MASLDTPVTHLKHREGSMSDRMCSDSRPSQHEFVHRTCSYHLLWALSVPFQESSLSEAHRQASHFEFRSHALGQGLSLHALWKGVLSDTLISYRT